MDLPTLGRPTMATIGFAMVSLPHFITLLPVCYWREGLYWKYSVSSGSAQSSSGGFWVLSTPNMASSRANPSCSTKVSGTPSACSTCSSRHVIQKDVLMIAQHGAGQQEPLSQRLVLELGDEVLAGN